MSTMSQSQVRVTHITHGGMADLSEAITAENLQLKNVFPVHGIKYTPLGISIVFNHELIAHKLLEQPGIDVNKKTCESTALHYACLRNSVSLIEAICAKVRTSAFMALIKLIYNCSLMYRRMSGTILTGA